MKTTSQIYFQGVVSQEPEVHGTDLMKLNQVCVYLERSDLLLWSIWICFNKNIAYLLVDQNIPTERLSHMILETGIETCITSSKYENKVPGIKKYILIDDYNDFYKLSSYYGKSETAYMVFTSGTTGVPKGIKISRNSTLSFIENFSQTVGFSPKDKILCLSSTNFDIFFVESILALYKGLDIVVVSESEKNSPRKLSEILQNENIDILQITPSRIQGFISFDADLKAFNKLKKIMIGGEVFPDKLLSRLQKMTNAKIYNLYGPSEATIWTSLADLTEQKKVSIGKPIPSYKMYILDKDLNLVTSGEVGQIAINAPYLAKGYINRPELSREKFITLNSIGEMAYLTGDIGRLQEDGNFYFLGRLDRQVKIHGNRVELEEVECVLQAMECINQVFVSKENTVNGDKLVAFLNVQGDIEYEKIEKALKKKIPEYMIPKEFVIVDVFPVTTNDKVSRNEILEAYRHELIETSVEIKMDYANDIERDVMHVILDNLNQNNIHIITADTTLNELGFDSLLYINLIVALEEKYGITFDDKWLIYGSFENVGQIVDYIMACYTNSDNKIEE